MIKLNLPIDENKIRELKVGDEVSISGKIITARDAAHKFLTEERPEEFKELLNGYMIYHCGPIVEKKDDKWRIVAAGPTTSIREEPYEADVIRDFGVKGIIGKGGMGQKTLTALNEYGCVYLHAVGGIAASLARNVKKVLNVYKLDEFGVPEAFWVCEVVDFCAVVTMDSHGSSLHELVLNKSQKKQKELFAFYE